MFHKTLCWLVVILEVCLGLLILVLLGTTQIYRGIALNVTSTLLLGLTPILAACSAMSNPKRACQFVLWLTPFAILVFIERLPLPFPFSVCVALASTFVPGLFWFLAARRNWPLPLSRDLHVAALISIACVSLVASVALSLMLPWWPLVGDCYGGPLLDESGKPHSVDFTARILIVGPKTFHGYSLFSIARVEERFATAIWSVPKFVVLRDFFRSTDRGEDFFVEGKRSLGPFTRLLPVVERVDCGHSRHVSDSDAIVSLRILRDVPPRNGVRVIGSAHSNWLKPTPVPGLEVFVKGPAGTIAAVTDEHGVYDVVGLPLGQYTVELPSNALHPMCALNLARRPVGECSFSLDQSYQSTY
jgi:hypothetical protein